MLRRFLVLGTAAALMAAPAAATAAPTQITERVEGASATLFEGSVTTDGKALDGHPCDGSSSNPPQAPGPTALSGLADAGVSWAGSWSDDPTYGGDFFVTSIGGEAAGGSNYWGLFVNGAASSAGGCQTRVRPGDRVLWAITDGSQPVLELSGPAKAATGEAVPLTVEQVAWDGTRTPAQGAQVAGAQTGADGHASISFSAPGTQTLKASRAGAIRSNAISVCVYQPGSGACDTVPATQSGGPPASTHDSTAPRARISSPRDGRRYRRGPRVIRGRASDDRALFGVYFRLRRYAAGGCRWYNAHTDRFSRPHHCAHARWVKLGAKTSWSYLLPKRLARGRYVLEEKSVDSAYNGTRERVDFRVTR